MYLVLTILSKLNFYNPFISDQTPWPTVLECGEDAPPPPTNGLVSVPDHRTTGTRAVYTCSPGYQ